jgi:hypothetical protein
MTRDEAKAAGLKRYMPTEPCSRGHLSERFVSSRNCCQCRLLLQQTPEGKARQSVNMAKYRQDNAEKIAAQVAAYRQANRENLAAQVAAYRQDNAEKIAAQVAAYRQANRENLAAKQAEYRKANQHIKNAQNAARRAAKLQATPPWTDFEAIKAIYRLCADVTRITGEKQHVDHIYPLVSDEVCGLHVAANLQILTASDNIKKGNKLLPMYEMPESAVE